MFTVTRPAPPKRRDYFLDGMEICAPEGAVMAAMALHLLASASAPSTARIHPDGQHLKKFDIDALLMKKGYAPMLWNEKNSRAFSNGTHTIVMKSLSGVGDVTVDGTNYFVECKGGTLTGIKAHPGVQSQLRRGLLELVGQLITQDADLQQIAAVPDTKTTREWAAKLQKRCAPLGIRIALVTPEGAVNYAF